MCQCDVVVGLPLPLWTRFRITASKQIRILALVEQIQNPNLFAQKGVVKKMMRWNRNLTHRAQTACFHADARMLLNQFLGFVYLIREGVGHVIRPGIH